MMKSEPKPPACVVVDLQNGDQGEESRLVVYANGRILYHLVENDWRSLIYGKGPLREEWVDLDDVARRWPDKVAEVHQALTRMRSNT